MRPAATPSQRLRGQGRRLRAAALLRGAPCSPCALVVPVNLQTIEPRSPRRAADRLRRVVVFAPANSLASAKGAALAPGAKPRGLNRRLVACSIVCAFRTVVYISGLSPGKRAARGASDGYHPGR